MQSWLKQKKIDGVLLYSSANAENNQTTIFDKERDGAAGVNFIDLTVIYRLAFTATKNLLIYAQLK